MLVIMVLWGYHARSLQLKMQALIINSSFYLTQTHQNKNLGSTLLQLLKQSGQSMPPLVF